MDTLQTTIDQSHDSQHEPQSPASEVDLRLSYKNEAENTIVTRKYINQGSFIREIDQEYMYNYTENQWEVVNRFVHTYDLADDGETLLGDGSNWKGTGQQWREWFTHRHYYRLSLRFPNDEIPDNDGNHDPVDLPAEIAV